MNENEFEREFRQKTEQKNAIVLCLARYSDEFHWCTEHSACVEMNSIFKWAANWCINETDEYLANCIIVWDMSYNWWNEHLIQNKMRYFPLIKCSFAISIDGNSIGDWALIEPGNDLLAIWMAMLMVMFNWRDSTHWIISMASVIDCYVIDARFIAVSAIEPNVVRSEQFDWQPYNNNLWQTTVAAVGTIELSNEMIQKHIRNRHSASVCCRWSADADENPEKRMFRQKQ